MTEAKKTEIEVHPVQADRCRRGASVLAVVSRRAYEVYSRVWAPQEALITGHCRGGFGVNELVAFLYARSFPESEWRARFREACEGMQGL